MDKLWWTQSVSIYYNIKKSIKLLITWIPCKLLHIPETNDEQENVAGESFLDICRIK